MKILLFLVLSVGVCAGCEGNEKTDPMESSVGGQAVMNDAEPVPAGGERVTGSMNSSPGTDALPPSTAKEMQVWLVSKNYGDWAAESGPHESTGPHGTVRTFVNPTLEASLAAMNTQHPVGSASVKELYQNGAVYGYAVSVKLDEDSAGGEGWYWYESFNTDPDGPAAFQSRGHPTCVGCHERTGNDFISTPYPLQ